MGLPKKTKAFSFCKFYKGFRDPRRERYLRPVPLHIGELVQIVVDDQMIVPVQGRQSGLGICQIELIAGGVLAWLLHRSEENRIILFFRAQHIVPLLNKQDGCFRSCMRLKTLPCSPTTARMRQRSAIYSRSARSVLLLNRPCGRTTAMRPPGFRKFRLRSIKRISLLTLFCHFPIGLLPSSYREIIVFSLISPANGGLAMTRSNWNRL